MGKTKAKKESSEPKLEIKLMTSSVEEIASLKTIDAVVELAPSSLVTEGRKRAAHSLGYNVQGVSIHPNIPNQIIKKAIDCGITALHFISYGTTGKIPLLLFSLEGTVEEKEARLQEFLAQFTHESYATLTLAHPGQIKYAIRIERNPDAAQQYSKDAEERSVLVSSSSPKSIDTSMKAEVAALGVKMRSCIAQRHIR